VTGASRFCGLGPPRPRPGRAHPGPSPRLASTACSSAGGGLSTRNSPSRTQPVSRRTFRGRGRRHAASAAEAGGVGAATGGA
jgi:hypothetical protein